MEELSNITSHSLVQITSKVITRAYCGGADMLFKSDTQYGERDRKQMVKVLCKNCKCSVSVSGNLIINPRKHPLPSCSLLPYISPPLSVDIDSPDQSGKRLALIGQKSAGQSQLKAQSTTADHCLWFFNKAPLTESSTSTDKKCLCWSVELN